MPWLCVFGTGYDSRRLVTALIGGLALLAVASCNGDDISALPEAKGSGMNGAWAYCDNAGGTDSSETVWFTGPDTFQVINSSFTSTDGSCSAGRVDSAPLLLVYQLGGPVSANFAGTTVTARAFDFGPSPGPVGQYIITYVDTTASPLALYFGFGAPPLDGSDPTLRPTTLDVAPPFPYLLQ